MRYLRSSGWRMSENVRRPPVKATMMASLIEIMFNTLFQSLGDPLPCGLLDSLSFFQFDWSFSDRKEVLFSSLRGRRPFSSIARLLPFLNIMLIHWKNREEKKLIFSSCTVSVIFSYPEFFVIFYWCSDLRGKMTTSQVAHNSNKKPKYHFSDSFSTRLEITGLYIRTMVRALILLH